MKLSFFVVMIGIFLSAFSGTCHSFSLFGDSNIEIVQKSTWHGDTSINYKNAFEKHKYFIDYRWEEKEDSQGRKIVTFISKMNYDKILNDMSQDNIKEVDLYYLGDYIKNFRIYKSIDIINDENLHFRDWSYTFEHRNENSIIYEFVLSADKRSVSLKKIIIGNKFFNNEITREDLLEEAMNTLFANKISWFYYLVTADLFIKERDEILVARQRAQEEEEAREKEHLRLMSLIDERVTQMTRDESARIENEKKKNVYRKAYAMLKEQNETNKKIYEGFYQIYGGTYDFIYVDSFETDKLRIYEFMLKEKKSMLKNKEVFYKYAYVTDVYELQMAGIRSSSNELKVDSLLYGGDQGEFVNFRTINISMNNVLINYKNHSYNKIDIQRNLDIIRDKLTNVEKEKYYVLLRPNDIIIVDKIFDDKNKVIKKGSFPKWIDESQSIEDNRKFIGGKVLSFEDDGKYMIMEMEQPNGHFGRVFIKKYENDIYKNYIGKYVIAIGEYIEEHDLTNNKIWFGTLASRIIDVEKI